MVCGDPIMHLACSKMRWSWFWCRFGFFIGFNFFFNICWQNPRYCSHRLLVFGQMSSWQSPHRAVLQTVNNDLSEKLKHIVWIPLLKTCSASIAHRIKVSYLSNLSRSGLYFPILPALPFIIHQATHAQTHTPYNNEHSTLLPSIEATGSHWVCPLSILRYWFDSSGPLPEMGNLIQPCHSPPMLHGTVITQLSKEPSNGFNNFLSPFFVFKIYIWAMLGLHCSTQAFSGCGHPAALWHVGS